MSILLINDSCYGHLEFFKDDDEGMKSALARFGELVEYFKSQASAEDPDKWLDDLHIDRVELGTGVNYWADSGSIIYSYSDYLADMEVF